MSVNPGAGQGMGLESLGEMKGELVFAQKTHPKNNNQCRLRQPCNSQAELSMQSWS